MSTVRAAWPSKNAAVARIWETVTTPVPPIPVMRIVKSLSDVTGRAMGGVGTAAASISVARRDAGVWPGVTVTNDGQSPFRHEKSRLHELWSMRVLRPNSVETGCTERQLDFSPQSPHPSQMRSLITTRCVGVGIWPRLRLRRFSAAQC